MLVSLHVKDLALIEEAEVLWKDGLNILTGETGAGKSVIIGSVRLALGAAMSSILGNRGDRECIRTGAEYALVELVFSSHLQAVTDKLKELDLPVEEDGSIYIQRKIMPSRSVCKVNGETTTARQLKELASLLIDIHGQHDTQTLLNVKKHSRILDDYGGEAVSQIKERLKSAFQSYETFRKELHQAESAEENREKELALAEFEVSEISAANLKPGEDVELEERFRRMNHGRKITESMSRVSQALGSETEASALNGVSHALREIRSVSSLDEQIQSIEEQIIQIDDLLSDVNRSVDSYLDGIQFSPEEYRETEERLNQLNLLKSKYGNTLEQVLNYQKEQEEKLERFSDYDSYLSSLKKRMEEAEKEVVRYSSDLSSVRKKLGKTLGQKMEQSLKELNFVNVQFEVSLNTDETKRSEEGFDDVEFMISLNPGEPLKPMNLVASGGELSRIMLALKTIMADKDQIETLIFDEIDSGISGRTAWKVSEKMAVLGKTHQLICITHLPQIAAMADAHYLIEKNTDESRAITDIRLLDEKEQLEETARLLGSDTITETTLANASELRKQALQLKES